MDARGESALDATALSVMPVNHAYEAQVELEIPEGAQGGLLLSGGRRGGGWAVAGLKKGQAFTDYMSLESQLAYASDRIFVRLPNVCHDVSCSYSMDGRTWAQFPKSTEVTGARRLSLFAAGEGQVIFKSFVYRGLD